MDSFNKKRQQKINSFFKKKPKVESENNDVQSYNNSNSNDLFNQSDLSVNDIIVDCENIANNQCNTSNITSTSAGDVLVMMTGLDIGLIIGRPRHQVKNYKDFIYYYKNIGLDLNFLRGQGYDGASAMRGNFNGVQAVVRRSYPLALYSHCSSHSLNLAISDACNIKSIRNATGTLQAIYVFFKTPKRQDILKKTIDKIAPENKKKKLKDLCPTRWVERHESVMVFLELFESIVEVLEEISDWVDRETSSKSNNLLCSIKNGEFLLAVHVLAKAFSISLPLSRQLQNEELDLVKAIELAEDVFQAVMELRRKAETEFKEIYTEVNKKCEILGVEITIPRITKNQQHRSNFTTNSSKEYFRLSIYISFLDGFSNQLVERFLEHKSLVKNFSCLLSDVDDDDDDDDDENIDELLKIYAEDIEVDEKSAKGEFLVWKQQIKKSTPKNVIDALHNCSSIIFPIIHRLLVILATLPVTTSASERSFSTLRRLKSYLRNTVGENMLNGLALMNIHRYILISTAEIIDELALQCRRLKFK